MEYWNDGFRISINTPTLHCPSLLTPSPHYAFRGGFSIRLRPADVIKAQPNSAKDKP